LFILAIFPKGAKVVVGISGALFLASSLLTISNRAALIGKAWSIGMAISTVLVWLDANKKSRQLKTAIPDVKCPEPGPESRSTP